MNPLSTEHDKQVVRLVKELEDQGYTVILEPASDNFPFSLGSYVPDLFASKAGEHLIVEVKSSDSAHSAQRLKGVAEVVEKHPGWRFLIKNIQHPDPVSPVEYPPPDLKTIEDHLTKAERIFDAGLPELSIPYLWNVLISLLRNQAEREKLPYIGLSDRSLINQHYTMGLVSTDDYSKLKRWQALRNDAVHSVSFQADPKEVGEFKNFVETLATNMLSQTCPVV